MTFLAPALLALGLAVAVPLILHLLQRHQGPRVVFPALRYLRRAERESATRIRLRQVLLLALRVLAVLLLAAAAARPFLPMAGETHHPTSVVLVLDNSLGSGAVVGERQVLDYLKDAALATLERAGSEDRFWVLRAGQPWEPAVRGDAAVAAEAVRRTEATAGGADLTAAVERAATILATEPEARAREIHLLSDLRRSSLRPSPDGAGPPVLVLVPPVETPAQRAVTAVEVGGGLPPRAGERSTVAATIRGFGGAPPTDSVDVRLVVEGTVHAVARTAVGSTALLPLPARPPGLVAGHVEIDRDALAADDRRFFVTEVLPPPTVALAEPLPFVDEALDVLQEAGRLQRTPGAAELVIAPGAVGVEALRRGAGVLLLPPASPLELAAANQRLAGAEVPWRLGPPGGGEARLDAAGSGLEAVLEEVRLRQVYALEPVGDPEAAVLLRLRDGQPWAVAGDASGGRYVLLATPLTAEGSTIPTSAAMLPLLDRALSGWAADTPPTAEFHPGHVITLPAADTMVRPDGRRDPVQPGGVYRLATPGVYRALRGGATIAAYAVNPPAEASDVERADPRVLSGFLSGDPVRSVPARGWTQAIFHQRIGREVSLPLVAVALAVLLLESALAAPGRARPART
jgi:hypothetical protein